MSSSTLDKLTFSDLFVTESNESSWYKQTPDSLRTQPVPVECYQELSGLRHLLEKHGQDDFRIDWPISSDDSFRLRVGRMVAGDDRTIFVCRRFRVAPGPLASLGVPPTIAEKLMSPDLKEGLVILLGRTGSGKTTTAASLVLGRLDRYGGVCWTIENPIELNMQGTHGLGVCYQTEILADEDIENSMRHIYRATPNIIFIGELRNGTMVREAVSASTSGHLVVATFHAGDLITGVARLARLSGGDTANAALSDALRVAIHVSLQNAENRALPGTGKSGLPGTGTPPRVLLVEPLWMNNETSDGLKSIVRSGDFQLLKSEVERQKRQMMMSRLP